MSSQRGYTLLEMLAVVMLVGLLAMTGLGLVTSLAHAIDEDGVSMNGSERRLRSVRRFRAAAARASDAIAWGPGVAFAEETSAAPGRGGGAGAGVAAATWTTWCVRGGVLATGGNDPGTCDAAAMRLERHARGQLVVVELPEFGRVVARVGGDAP